MRPASLRTPTTSKTSTPAPETRRSRKPEPPGPPVFKKTLFLFGRPVEQDLVVGTLGQFHLLGHAPCQRLLVQRNVGVVLDGDLERLLDHLVALGLVGLRQHLVRQRVELLVAPATEIGFATRGLRIVTAA